MISHESVEGIHQEAIADADRKRELGLLILKHKDEFKGLSGGELRVAIGNVARSKDLDSHDAVNLGFLCMAYDKKRGPQITQIGLWIDGVYAQDFNDPADAGNHIIVNLGLPHGFMLRSEPHWGYSWEDLPYRFGWKGHFYEFKRVLRERHVHNGRKEEEKTKAVS